MVKNIFSLLLILLFVILANSCFVIYTEFVYDSDVDERRQEMNNTHLLPSLPSLDIGSGSYSFIVLTDTHLEGGKPDGIEKLPHFVIDYNAENNTEIKFAIILGDITDGRENDYKLFMEIAKELPVPLYPVIGNHDLIGNGWGNWKKYIGSTNYRIDDANTTLIILDSASIYFGKSQMDWLERELKQDLKRDVFVFTHVSLFAPGYLVQIDMNERARMASLLKNKCDIMFAGHTHVRHTQKTGNVQYMTVESFRDDKAYCLVTVTDSGITYTWGKL